MIYKLYNTVITPAVDGVGLRHVTTVVYEREVSDELVRHSKDAAS